MAGNSLVVPGVLVALGGGVVVAMVLFLGGGEAGTAGKQQPEASSSVLVAQGGVRPADVDPAGRVDLDPKAGDEPPASPPEPAAAVVPEEAARREVMPPPEPPPPPPPLTEEQQAAQEAYLKLREQAAKEVGRQLGEQQSALRKACWKHAGGASKADFSVNASFDGEGKLLAMGISDVRGPDGSTAAAVGQCVRQQAIALSVEPSGQGVSVDVPLHLP